jgi:trigger factor
MSDTTIVNYSEVSDSRREFEIEVPPDRIEKVRRGVTRTWARRAALPGFRKGKVPEAVIARKFAHEIQEEVLEQLIPEALTDAFREKGVQPLGHPTIQDVKFEEGKPLAFRANVDVRPPIEPGRYQEVEATDVPVEPTTAEVELSLERIRESHAEFLPIEGRPAADGDFAIADVASRPVEAGSPLLYTGAGEAIGQEKTGDWRRDEKVTLEVGHPDSMPEINEALRGLSPGQSRAFRKTFAADFGNAEYAGKTFEYELSLMALKEKKLPPLDDAFASHLVGAASLEELREKITRSIRMEKEAARRRKLRREILDSLLDQTSISAPEVLVEAETESSLEEYAAYLTSRGGNPKEADWDTLAREARPGAQRRVREYLLLDEIARREKLEVSETEVDAELRRSAARRQIEPQALRERLEKEGRLGSIREEIRLQKSVDWLIEHARLRPPPEK